MGHLKSITPSEASDTLSGLRQGLNADGYDLEVSTIDDKVRLRIVALDGACEDCLSPPSVMTRIFAAALQERESSITPDDIVIQYPADH